MGNQWLAYKMIQPLMRPVITMNIDNRFMVSKCRARGRKASDPITSRTRNLLQEHRSRRTVALRWRYQRRYFTRVLIPVEVPRFSGRLLSTGAARSQFQSTEMSLPNRNVVRFARATRGYGNQPVIGSIEFPRLRGRVSPVSRSASAANSQLAVSGPGAIRRGDGRLTADPSMRCCVCGAALWYVRARVIGEEGHFHCRRCGARYCETQHWYPGMSCRRHGEL